MAHGFLTPQPVSGDNFWKNAKSLADLAKGLGKLFKKDLRVVNANIKEVRDLLEGGKEPKALPPAANKMLKGNQPKGLLAGAGAIVARKAGIVNTQAKTDIVGRNATDIDRKEQKYLGTTDPDVAGGPRTRKGGSYVNMPGVSAPSGGLKDSSFFSKTGELDIEKLRASGKSADEQKSIVREYRANLRAKGIAPTGETGAPPITPDSGADIVAAVNKNTEAIVALSNLTKEQTNSQRSMHNEQQAQSDKLANRALARSEEKSLEKGSDLSGFLTPQKFKRLSGGTGGGGGRGDGPGMGIGGKVATGALVKAVGKRGAQRVGTRLAAKYGGKAAAKAAGKYGGKAAAKLGLGGAAKIGAGAIAKSAGKKIPLVGLGLGAIFAAQRALEGDFVGAGLELASGAASTVPGIGTAGSIGIDAALAARDMGMTPFAKGGIITQPTNALMGEAGKEGVFPLEGKRGRDTFLAMGEGILEAQKKAKMEFADLQSAGLKAYFENKGGFKAFGEAFKLILGPLFGNLAGGIIDKVGNFANGVFGIGSGNPQGGGLQNANMGSDEEDYLMRLMIAEAGGEGELGMAAVARSVMNRAGLIQSGKVGAGTFMADSGSIMDVINAKGQYQPVAQGKLKRALTPEEKARAMKALEMARNSAALRGNLEASGMSADQVNNIMASTGFRTGAAFNDSSQNVNRTKLGNHIFNTAGNTGMLTADAQFAPSTPQGTGGGAALAAAANSLKGMSTASGPDGGANGCVYAVNKVFSQAGITPPWGSALYVPTAEEKMISAGWQQVPYNQMQPGDVFVMKDQKSPPQAHIGVATDNKFILSNSSGKASMSWSSTAQGYNEYYGGVGTLYRMPGGQAPATANATPGAPPSSPAAASPVASASPAATPPASPGPIAAAPASPNTGTPIMATSAQVASASSAPAAAPTVINNYYGGGQQQTGVNPNGVSAGIDMNATGLAAFQDLKIRTIS